MPYELKPDLAKKDHYFVVTKATGKKHSERSLTKEQAVAQLRALYSATGQEARK